MPCRIWWSDGRRNERVAAKDIQQNLVLAEDVTVQCTVLDFSISGASIATPARPAIGTEVKLGNLRARVARHHDAGIGLQFLDVQNPTAIRRYFG